jgi:alpha-beta hydrolase superfamily lysophospholipase
MDRARYPEKFASADGLELYANWYLPEGEIRAGLLIVHGFADHGARYEHVAKRFTEIGYAVLAADYRGNGRAAGPRGHCDQFEEFVWDLEAAAKLLRGVIGDRPLGIYAHSHGALVTLLALTQRRALSGVRAVALTSPFLAMGTMKVPKLLLKLARPVSWILPKLAQPHGIPPDGLTHDKALVDAAGSDPLRHKVATTRWLIASTDARAQVRRDIAQVKMPTSWMIGTADPIASPEATRAVYALVPEPKQLVAYEGFLHELVNEVERKRVLDDLVAWFERTMPRVGAGAAVLPTET